MTDDVTRRLTPEEIAAYWKERLTDEQIAEIGGGLDYTEKEQEGDR